MKECKNCDAPTRKNYIYCKYCGTEREEEDMEGETLSVSCSSTFTPPKLIERFLDRGRDDCD